jgi:hypothetical protein
MDETTLRELLGSALAGEPPIGPVAQNALRAGIRRRRRRVLGAAGGVAVVAVVAVIPTVFSQHGAPPRQVTASGTNPYQHDPSPQPPAGSHAGTNPPFNGEAAARAGAVTWILQQVSRSAVVACDAQVCADLQRRGFPAANLKWLGPQSYDPSGSDLVVATAAIRAQFGRRLASDWAPAVIASFGSGNAKIDIRWEYSGGGAQYRADQGTAVRARKAADVQLLTNKQLTVSATAQAQLRSGDIDPRLPVLIGALAQAHPVRIVDFGGWSPGGGPASLLRWVDLAAGGGAHLTPAAYLRWMRSFISVQRAQYRPDRIQQVTLRTGQTVLRIEYLAPSPLR